MSDSRAVPPGGNRSIVTLPEQVEALPAHARDLFSRLYHLNRSSGHLVVPESSRDWVEESFGSVETVESQQVVRLTNLATMEGAVFNPLRALRPVQRLAGELPRIVEESRGDQFCSPEEQTPADVFGRVRGRHSITASNVAKYAPFHGLVISDQHDPLKLTEDGVRDYLETGRRWAAEVLRLDPEARYYFFAWNALWSSGASVIHGHAQVSCSKGIHYSKVEQLRRSAVTYRERFGESYFDALEEIHGALGLAFRYEDVAVVAHLTPARDREVLLLANETSAALAGALYRALDCLINDLGTSSFNVAICQPPLSAAPEDWSGFPCVARIVDRGDPMKRTSDVGAMEIYGTPVVSTDPFRLAAALRARFGR